MGQTSQFDDFSGEHGFITGVVIDHQMPAPSGKESARVRASPAALIVENDNRRRPPFKIVAAIGPQIGAQGFPHTIPHKSIGINKIVENQRLAIHHKPGLFLGGSLQNQALTETQAYAL